MLIVLLEDDDDYAEIIAHVLERDGHDVVVTRTVESALAFASRKPPGLAVLDVVLPDGSGIDACRRLREKFPQLPVLFLSSLDRSADIVAGLESGGDDYLTKPFHPSELLARVRALLRRAQSEHEPQTEARNTRLTVGNLALDLSSQSAAYKGAPVDLTPIEVEVLWQLAKFPGQALTHAYLTEQVWGYKNVSDATLLKGHISSIRRKLRDAGGDEELVRTMHGVGYCYTPV
jgi:DNA-binding response OmpR family regulator